MRDVSPPFATWRYAPPYLPAGASFAMGSNSRELDEPLLFVLPWSRTASWHLPDHPNGAEQVTRVTLGSAPSAPSTELRAFHGLGLVDVEEGPGPLLQVELDGRREGGRLDLRPDVPLLVCW